MSYNLSDLWTSMSWETKAAMGTGQRDDCSGQLLLFLLTKTPFSFPKIMQQIKQMYWENKYISQIRNKVHNWCHKCHGWRLIKSRKKNMSLLLWSITSTMKLTTFIHAKNKAIVSKKCIKEEIVHNRCHNCHGLCLKKTKENNMNKKWNNQSFL